ncbi:substrate-binding periplasmic protein [Methylomonas sp. MgM2]
MTIQRLLIRLSASILILLWCSLEALATGPRIKPDLFSSNANTIYALDFPPFVTNDLANGGVALELANAALETEKIDAPIISQPLARMLKYYLFQEQALAVIGGHLNFSAQEKEQLIFLPLLRLKTHYFFNRGKHPQGLSWSGNLQAFANMVYGAYPEEDVDAYRQAGIRIQSGKLLTLLEQLKNGAIDFISEAAPAVDWFLTRNFSKDQSQFVRMEPAAGELTIFVIFNKKHPQGEAIANRFKNGLAAIVASGQYQDVLEKQFRDDGMGRYTLPIR